MARQLTGSTSNYLSSTLAINLPADWTILFRIKNVVSTGDHQIFMGRRGADTSGWAVGRDSTGGFFFWGFGGTSGGSGSIATGSTGFDAYALTRASSGTGTFYKNSTTALGTASITPGSSTGTGINLGNMNNAGTPSFPANCELAEVAIFSRVLNSTELGQWFSGDSPSLYDTGLIHYWKLDAASGGETATVGGYNLSQVGTVGSTTHPTMNYGAGNAAPTFPGPNIGNLSGTVGTALTSNNVASKFSDTDALTFSAVGSWPPGVTVSSAGIISGTPTTAGTYSGLAVRATDTAAQTVDSDTFSFTIGAAAAHLITVANSQQANTGSSVAVQQAGNGTITLPAIKDWGTGNVKAGETGVTLIINNATTGALVSLLTGQTTNASGVLPTLTGLVSGTAYRITTILADGSEGTWKYTAV